MVMKKGRCTYMKITGHCSAMSLTYTIHGSVFSIWKKFLHFAGQKFRTCKYSTSVHPNFAYMEEEYPMYWLRVKDELKLHLDVKDLGNFRSFLGVMFIRGPDGAWLPQRHYVNQVL